jgi:hypothetical protein
MLNERKQEEDNITYHEYNKLLLKKKEEGKIRISSEN